MRHAADFVRSLATAQDILPNALRWLISSHFWPGTRATRQGTTPDGGGVMAALSGSEARLESRRLVVAGPEVKVPLALAFGLWAGACLRLSYRSGIGEAPVERA